MSSIEKPVRWVLYNSETKLQSIPVHHEEIQWTVMRMRPADWTKYFIWRDGWQNWQPLEPWLKSNQTEIIVDFLKKTEDDVETLTEHTATVRVDKFSVEDTPDKRERKTQSSDAKKTDSAKSQDAKQSQASKNSQPQKLNEEKDFDPENSTIVDWDDHLARLFAEGSQDFSGDLVTEHVQRDPTLKPISFKPPEKVKAEQKVKYKNRAERHTLKIEVLFSSPKGTTFKTFSANISLSGTLLDDELPLEFINRKFEAVVINRFAKTPQNARLQLFAKCPIPSAPNRIQFVDMRPEQKQKLKVLLEQYLKDRTEAAKKPAA